MTLSALEASWVPSTRELTIGTHIKKKRKKKSYVLGPAFSHLPSIKGTCSSHYALLPPHHTSQKGSWVFRAMGWGTRRIRKGRKEQLVNRMWSFSHHSGQYPQKCTQVGVGRWKWGRRNRRQGKGVEQKKKKKRGKKKKRELVLPSGGLRSLCEMRWGGSVQVPVDRWCPQHKNHQRHWPPACWQSRLRRKDWVSLGDWTSPLTSRGGPSRSGLRHMDGVVWGKLALSLPVLYLSCG